MDEQAAQLRCPKCKTRVAADAMKCPGCGGLFKKGIEAGLTEGPRTCPDCAEEVKTNVRRCRFCGFTFPHACGEKVLRRYTDAYRVAGVIDGFGTLLKILGIVAAAVVALIGYGVTATINSSSPVLVSLPV